MHDITLADNKSKMEASSSRASVTPQPCSSAGRVRPVKLASEPDFFCANLKVRDEEATKYLNGLNS